MHHFLRLSQKSETKLLLVLTVLTVISFTACVKKSDSSKQPDQPVPVAAEVQTPKTIAPPPVILEPQPMKLCVRPAHQLGLKKCSRAGKWVRMSVAANDVDNDRIDVFSSPRISLKKENFYPDTFQFHDGVAHVSNYPDYYHANAAYGGFAHFIFAMPSQPQLSITYGYSGRDEMRAELTRSLPTINPKAREYVKIQHWNDGSTFKKFAPIYFEIIGDYSELNYRYECTWMENNQGYDFSQLKTKSGIDVPKIPETFVWRKIAESCEQLPSRSADSKFTYLPFNEISQNSISTEHKFTNANRNKFKIYNVKNTHPDFREAILDTLNPMSQNEMKIDGSTTIFMNNRKEEISRWESIYSEDLKDLSFQPERVK